MKNEGESGNAGETPRQRVGRYMFVAGASCIVGAFYFAEFWRAALWLASVGIILAYVGAVIQS